MNDSPHKLRILPALLVLTLALAAAALPSRALAGSGALPEVANVEVGIGQFAVTSVRWDPLPGAFYYRAYRALLSDLPNYCSQFNLALTETDFLDGSIPPPGDAFVYMITAVGPGGEGDLGQTTAGVDRKTTRDCDPDQDGFPDSVDNCPHDSNPTQQDQNLDLVGDVCEYVGSGTELLARVPVSTFPIDPGLPHEANEMWHYVSPGGEEYAILGLRNATAFIRVTDPSSPFLAGFVDGGDVNQSWRDMAVYEEYAYIVSDGDGVGLQIADLSDIDNDNVVLAATTDLGMNFVDAHNVFVNQDSGFLYLAIPNLNGGLGLSAFDLNANPANPAFAGFWTDTDPNVRCHDLYVLSYTSGPAAGKEVAYCFAENDGLRVVDVTNKAGMTRMAKLIYPNTTYSHQGWISDDLQYVYIGDESDESSGAVSSTTTYVVDVADPANPQYVTAFTNGLPSIDHNLMVREGYVYEANYSSGGRIFSACNVNRIREVGFFDSHPEDDFVSFQGAWGIDPLLPSGTVLLSDRQRGLLVLDASAALEVIPDEKCTAGNVPDDVCDACVDLVCQSKPSCCNANWSSACVEDVRTECGSLRCGESAGSCSHTLCTEGAPLSPACDTPPAASSCVDAVCIQNPACCLVAWDASCVAAVGTACGMNCD